MLYDIYFHNDFDGRAAAALLLDFFRKRGDDFEHFVPLGYDMLDTYKKEIFFKTHRLFKGQHNPAVVVDFSFHPGAAWWFDHHSTTFRKDEWRRDFQPTLQLHYDPDFDSCCGQVAAVLKRDFGWKPAGHVKELIKWGDIVDGARHRSVREVMDLTNVGVQLDAYLDAYANDSKRTGKRFIEDMAARSVASMAKDSVVQKAIVAIMKRRKTALDFHRKNMEVADRVGFIDLSSKNFEKIRYAGYYLYPKILYTVRVLIKGGLYQVSVGQNPWRRKENKVDIGELMRKYGGGGHFAVGATEFRKKADALRAANEITEHLRKHMK